MSQNLFFTARRLVAHTQFPPKSPFVYSSVDDRVLIPYPPSLPAKRRGQGKSKAINCWFIPLLHSSVVVDNINLVSFFFLLFSIWPNFHMLGPITQRRLKFSIIKNDAFIYLYVSNDPDGLVLQHTCSSQC